MNKLGEIKTNNFGSIMEIINYRCYTDIDIYFPEYDWIYKHAAYNAFKNGRVKCPYEPRTYSVGYLGEGIYTASVNNIKSEAYKCWCHMLNRCYQSNRESYQDCYVCDEWLNFQNFAEWYYNNYYEIPGEVMCLDKDILVKYNKIYSPETCIFVPNRINMLFVKANSIRGDLPIGVHKSSNKFIAECKNCSTHIYLGSYDSPEEAFLIYKRYKEQLIKNIADDYQDYIPQILYDTMYNYSVEIDD